MSIEEFKKLTTPVDLKQVNADLKKYVEALKKLDEGKTKDWSNTDDFCYFLAELGLTPSIKLLEDLLSHYKAKKEKILKFKIPDIMKAAGISEITTEDRIKIKLELAVSAKILNNPLFLEWVDAEQLNDLVKENLTFNKGEELGGLFETLEKEGFSYERKTAMHTGTLKKLVKQRMEGGEKLPSEDVLKADPFHYAKVTY